MSRENYVAYPIGSELAKEIFHSDLSISTFILKVDQGHGHYAQWTLSSGHVLKSVCSLWVNRNLGVEVGLMAH